MGETGSNIGCPPFFNFLTFQICKPKIFCVSLQCKKRNVKNMLFFRRKHKKHKNRTPWKSEDKKRCDLSKVEYNSFISKMVDRDCSAVVIRVD